MLHLIYRLVVQPNTSRAQTFADAFISSGGIETLLVLLQHEVKAGDDRTLESPIEKAESPQVQESELDSFGGVSETNQGDDGASVEEKERISYEIDCEPESISIGGRPFSPDTHIERTTSLSENPFLNNLGGISFSISADNARNNAYNVDKSDRIVVGIIGLLGALVSSGHLKFGASTPADMIANDLHEGGGTMFDDKVSLLLFALQKAFQAAPNRLMTSNVYTALLGASVCDTICLLFLLSHLLLLLYLSMRLVEYSHTMLQILISRILVQ